MEMTIHLSEGDQRGIKATEGICRGLQDCWMMLDADVVDDVNHSIDFNFNLPMDRPVQAMSYSRKGLVCPKMTGTSLCWACRADSCVACTFMQRT
jgi:hypothetical protein